ncbi:MAG: heme ABC transporter ATP-binding protein, partial [Myxococcota bacterium]
GEQQRVQIARVLTQLGESVAGRIAIFDEPIANLDISQQLRCMTIARSLADRGAAVMVSVHDLNFAARFSDRVVLLDGGCVVSDDVPEQALSCEHVSRVFDVDVHRTEVGPGIHQLVFNPSNHVS